MQNYQTRRCIIILFSSYCSRYIVSGYEAKFRIDVVKSALKAYDNFKSLETCDKKPMDRTRQWRQDDGTKEKRNKQDNWYSKNTKFYQIGVNL